MTWQLPCKQNKAREKGWESPQKTQMWNAIIATRKIIYQRIAGPKEVLKLDNSQIPTIVSFCSIGQNCVVVQK